jgi:hypothetical protein
MTVPTIAIVGAGPGMGLAIAPPSAAADSTSR